MKELKNSLKALFTTLVMLSVSMSALADENSVLIDGVYYNLCNYWSYGYYDANGNWQSSQPFNNVAIVTYDHSIDPWSVNNRETYQGDIVIPDKVTKDGVDYPVVAVDN